MEEVHYLKKSMNSKDNSIERIKLDLDLQKQQFQSELENVKQVSENKMKLQL